MGQATTFRAVLGEITAHWGKAGEKHYTGLALLSEKGNATTGMLRLGPKTTGDEYRSFAEACRSAAQLAEEAATTADQAAATTAEFKLTPAQKQRILDTLKGLTPAARVAIAEGLDLELVDFGYLPDGRLMSAVKPPAPPNGSVARVEANKLIDTVLASAGNA